MNTSIETDGINQEIENVLEILNQLQQEDSKFYAIKTWFGLLTPPTLFSVETSIDFIETARQIADICNKETITLLKFTFETENNIRERFFRTKMNFFTFIIWTMALFYIFALYCPSLYNNLQISANLIIFLVPISLTLITCYALFSANSELRDSSYFLKCVHVLQLAQNLS